MSRSFIPQTFLAFPSFWLPLPLIKYPCLAVSEDEQNVYIEAPVPGVRAQDIYLCVEKGVLWIKAQKECETMDRAKRFSKAQTVAFQMRLPKAIDQKSMPRAVCRKGILTVTFAKSTQIPLKRTIPVQEA